MTKKEATREELLAELKDTSDALGRVWASYEMVMRAVVRVDKEWVNLKQVLIHLHQKHLVDDKAPDPQTRWQDMLERIRTAWDLIDGETLLRRARQHLEEDGCEDKAISFLDDLNAYLGEDKD